MSWAEALRGTIAKKRAIALTHRADDFLIAWFPLIEGRLQCAGNCSLICAYN